MGGQHHSEPLSRLAGLTSWAQEENFIIEDVSPTEVSITDGDGGNVWWLSRIGPWLQVRGLVFEDVNPTEALCLSLARLHSRLLGCRYGLDEENNILLHADIFPHDQSGSTVGEAILQMEAIVEHTYDLLQHVQESGIAADDGAIDEAFQLKGSGRLH
ncbi:MAG: hypothetical protein AB7V46_13410 [Thermomicrobiales bacterium]